MTLIITQDRVGQGSEQSSLVEDTPAYCKGLDWKIFVCPLQLKLFYDLV